MMFPVGYRRYYHSSNHIERLNRELKCRSDVIGVFPNEASLIRLMGSVLIEQNDGNMNTHKIFSSESYQVLMESGLAASLKAPPHNCSHASCLPIIPSYLPKMLDNTPSIACAF